MSEEALPLSPLNPPYFDHLHQLTQDPRFTQDVLHVEPTSFTQFQCTQCGDCCTSSWGIHLSQSYYHTWYDTFDKHPSGRFKTPFVRYDNATPEVYASMRRDAQNRCIFLEPDNSCYIHAHHGEEALSFVCRVYPRGHKTLQNFFSTRVLLESCEAVPDTLAQHPGFQFAWRSPNPAYQTNAHNFYQPDHLQAHCNFLWLGLSFDVLNAEAPSSVFQRWRCFLELLSESLPDDVSHSQLSHWQHIAHQIHARLPLYFPLPQDADTYARALQWLIRILPHPRCAAWLQQLHQQGQELPPLSSEEEACLNGYMQRYLENRLLGIAYGDLFWGQANFWEQNLMVLLAAVSIQTLARYHAHQQQEPLQTHHLQRASVNWTKVTEQRRNLMEQFRVKAIHQVTAQHALQILLALTPLH